MRKKEGEYSSRELFAESFPLLQYSSKDQAQKLAEERRKHSKVPRIDEKAGERCSRCLTTEQIKDPSPNDFYNILTINATFRVSIYRTYERDYRRLDREYIEGVRKTNVSPLIHLKFLWFP